MEESIINQKALEDAMRKALPSLFPSLLGTTSSARVEFYDKFQRVADEYDHDFIGKCGEDLDTTLIFAGLFSAVTGAFILDIQSKLEPDYQEMNHALLRIVASVALGDVPSGPDAAFPEWNGPDAAIVRVQAILYSSLAASLLAAFIGMLGKQWLNRYAQVEMRGSVIDRSRYRQRKMDGMVTWRFDLVMECLPLMLQAALLLLGYALSDYLFFINKVVSSILISFTAFGLLFYLLIVSAATLSFNCPFQTPLSLVLRFLVRFDDEHEKCLERSRKWIGRLFSKRKKLSRRHTGGPYNSVNTSTGNSSVDHVGLTIINSSDQLSPLFSKDADWESYVLDSNCIAWMFEMCTDPDFIVAIMKFIPDVVWHAGIRAVPLEELYDTLVGCFDCSSGSQVLIPKLKDKAYLSAKALLHLTIQYKCISSGSNKLLESISRRHFAMKPAPQTDNSDLESTLGIIDRIFGNSQPMSWQGFSFSTPHHIWMGHILVYHAWEALKNSNPLPGDIKEFISYSSQLDHPPPVLIQADCFFLIGFLLGITLHEDDLPTIDKFSQVDVQIDRIYKKLEQTFKDPTSGDINCALEVLELISYLPKWVSPLKNQSLFCVVMSSTVIQPWEKWKASNLAMCGACEWGGFEDAHHILTFLSHHFELVVEHGQNQDEPIQNALCALAHTSDSVTIKALEQFDPTQPTFVCGIIYAFQDARPFKLREAALLFLPLISNRWFSTRSPIIDPIQMTSFFTNWASTVEEVEKIPAVQKAALVVLLGMVNSPHWCPHIVPEKWMLLRYLMSVPEDFQSLHGYFNDPSLMEEIKKVDNPMAIVLWVEILWLKYAQLTPKMHLKLESITKEIAENEREAGLDMSQSNINRYLSNTTSELRRIEDLLGGHTVESSEPIAVLREKAGKIQQAFRALDAIKAG